MSLQDNAYVKPDFSKSRLPHHYGTQVHLMANSLLWTQLARLCDRETIQPEINHLVRSLYTSLIEQVVIDQFPTEKQAVQTRMVDFDTQPSRGCGVGKS